jgi:hypothetical protein
VSGVEASVEIPLLAVDRAKIAITGDTVQILFGVDTDAGAVPQCQLLMTPATARELRAALGAVLAQLR